MNYKVIDREKYYRKGVFRHFSEYGVLNIDLFFAPIINWGEYREENGRLVLLSDMDYVRNFGIEGLLPKWQCYEKDGHEILLFL